MARPPVPMFSAKPAVPKFDAQARQRADDDEDLRESLKIVGQSASLYHDDVTAAWLENQQHLQLWMENKEEDLWIDRYDVRQLLSDASLFAKSGRPAGAAGDDAEEKMIDAERYSDLPPEGEAAAPDQQDDGEEDEALPNRATPSNQFGAVHFSFGGQGASQPAQQRPIPPEIAAFANGWLTELAPGSALPQTFKQHQVIEKTAKFVHKEGKKMEAMLKVKHGGNAAFQFLLVDHPLQPYYQALLKYLGYCPEAADLPTLLPSVEQPAEAAPEAAEVPAEAAPAGGAQAAEQDSAAQPEASADAPAAADASSASADQADDKEEAAVAAKGAPASAANGEPASYGEAQNQEATATAEVSTTSTAQEGEGTNPGQIPVPPDEMLQTIEKLVRWILKSGRDFEKKVKERQRGDPRFEFLMPWNPYNAFYRQRLDDAFNGKLDEHVGDAATAASAAAAPPWRVNSYAPPLTQSFVPHPPNAPAGAVSSEAGAATNVPESTGGAVAGVQSAPQEDAAADAKPSDEENPKVQFITSFGDDSEEEQEEEETGGAAAATATAEQASATDEPKTEAEEAAPKKERNSRFGPDLSEAEKKAARLARAKQLSLLVKDKVEAVKTAEEADSKDKEKKEQKSSKESKRSRKSRSRSPKSRSSRRSSSRSRSGSRSSRRRRSRSRDRHARKHRKRDRSDSRERKRRRSSRSRSRDRSRSRSRDRHRERRSDREKSRYKDRDRSPKQKSRRRSRSPHHRRRRSTSRSRSRSRSRSPDRSSKASASAASAASKLSTAGTSSSPPRPSAREEGAAADAGGGTEGSAVSAELRDKVRAMLAAQLGS